MPLSEPDHGEFGNEDDALSSLKKNRIRNRPLCQWIPERSSYLDEMIHLEGRGNNILRDECNCKGEGKLLYHCHDCFGVEMMCHTCVLDKHTHNTLHRIEEWHETFFIRISLKSLGLPVQLSHNPGEKCYNPEPTPGDDFVVINVHGIHEISLDFCGCETAQAHYKQLLCARWFPATVSNPQTAATFALMELFHLLSFESKVSAYEFYHSIARRTDNMSITPIRDRYSVFMCMVHEWRHLKQLKHAGRGHDPHGVDAASAGACAVLCPACPQPGKNLPDNWENAPGTYQIISWMYALFLAIDANFQLKRKLMSSDNVDPSLNAGWSYFVKDTAYKQYLSERGCEPQEKSTCVSHNAVKMADTKTSRGLAATGVRTVDCARHDMKLPNRVGDLQKGEKYLNMDYLVFSALLSFLVFIFNLSYDVACQWHKKLWTHMDSMPPCLHFARENKTIRFFVLKFHLNAHIQQCQTTFSFNCGKNVGRTDGEAPERGWANINRVASSMKEMGPGARRDTLDDHFGDWNWKKITILGRQMLRKIKQASSRAKVHREELHELERIIPAPSLSAWRSEIIAWEEDHTKPNPFESRIKAITQAAIRRQLAEKDAADLQAGADVSLHTDISASVLIASGIDLQDQQQCLAVDASSLGQHATDTQKTKIYNQSNALQRRLDNWIRIQVLYVPAVGPIRSAEEAEHTAVPKPEEFKLWLPSELDPHLPCYQKLRHCEWELRYAQAHDALNDVRQNISNIQGQHASTRACTALDLATEKIHAGKAKYDAAQAALAALAPLLGKIGWSDTLCPLLASDTMQPMGDFIQGQSEGTHSIPWIWKTPGVLQDNDEGLQDSRWSEEVMLLLEEMWRVLAFLTWQVEWWSGLSSACHFERLADVEGSVAYAKHQSTLRESMLKKFEQLWKIVPAIVAAELNDGIADTDGMPTIEGPPPLDTDD
ncbi:hypothetical protein EV424DRAFT_1472791 [Suillus variegatus]|nr:hypothetical protein EV424DRAFT_1472791 [Suillus variegatus]